MVSAGFGHTAALKTDGAVVVWGSNDQGQLKVLAGLNGMTSIAAGYAHTLVLKGPPAPRLRVDPRINGPALVLQAAAGWRYQSETSADLRTWLPLGDPFEATGAVEERRPAGADPAQYFRLRQIP